MEKEQEVVPCPIRSQFAGTATKSFCLPKANNNSMQKKALPMSPQDVPNAEKQKSKDSITQTVVIEDNLNQLFKRLSYREPFFMQKKMP